MYGSSVYGLYAVLRAIIAFIAYLVIGGVVMYFAKGARGIEVIPNITFWKDLPFLLKVNTISSTWCISIFSKILVHHFY